MADKKRNILAIDPGPVKSAYVWYDPREKTPDMFDLADNDAVLAAIETYFCHGNGNNIMAIEMIASYGMAVGASVFETCVWIGRFIEAWGGGWEYVYRKDVKIHICGSMKAKDTNIRRALLDRYPATGGGKTPEVGTIKQPGPLFGFKADMWAALAVAITFAEKGGA